MKVRIKFTKVGALRYVGHLDFMRSFQKIIRRSGVLAVFTRGFSPHMIMSFAAPLGVGLESLGEYVDFEMAYRDPYELTKIELQRFSQLGIENDELPDVPPEADIISMLNSEVPEGVRILSVKRIEDGKGKAMALVYASDNVVFLEKAWLEAQGISDRNILRDLLERFMAEGQIVIHKTTKKTESDVDIRPLIFELHLEEEQNARPQDSMVREDEAHNPGLEGEKTHDPEIGESLTENTETGNDNHQTAGPGEDISHNLGSANLMSPAEAVIEKANVYRHIESAGYVCPIFMKLKTGSSANLKPETVIEAFCAFAGKEYDPLALRILRLDLYGEDERPLSETGRSF